MSEYLKDLISNKASSAEIGEGLVFILPFRGLCHAWLVVNALSHLQPSGSLSSCKWPPKPFRFAALSRTG